MPRAAEEPDAPKVGTVVADFGGIILNADPRDVPEGGAEDQVNALSIAPGELRIRGGLVLVAFETF